MHCPQCIKEKSDRERDYQSGVFILAWLADKIGQYTNIYKIGKKEYSQHINNYTSKITKINLGRQVPQGR